MKSSTKDQARGSEPSHTTFLASEMRKCAAPGFRGWEDIGGHRRWAPAAKNTARSR